MAEPFLAQIIMFGGNFAPRSWAYCDGQLLPISQYTALFSILGTTYGGDGRTTFALPDLRGRVPIHAGSGPGLSTYRLGDRGGVEDVTLNTTQIPAHSHAATATSTASMLAESREGTVSTPAGNMLAAGSNIFRPNARTDDVAMDPAMVSVETSVQTQNAGGNLSHTNLQPFLSVHYIIALQGLFPSRS